MDALLGALSLGDIGKYFPPEDPKWKGANSLELLKQVHSLVTAQGWQINNIDAVIIAERPKLKPYIGAMGAAIANQLCLNADQVGIKATTNEKLGPEGREEGISCHAVALLMQL
jgi:2-C-methyl-D-erythritol 2,4-cyclodiphosphate synthase